MVAIIVLLLLLLLSATGLGLFQGVLMDAQVSQLGAVSLNSSGLFLSTPGLGLGGSNTDLANSISFWFTVPTPPPTMRY